MSSSSPSPQFPIYPEAADIKAIAQGKLEQDTGEVKDKPVSKSRWKFEGELTGRYTMLNQAETFRVKILKIIFATISLGLVFLGLVSCGISQTSPPAIEKPKIDSDPSPEQTDVSEDEDEEDEEKDQDYADQDDKSDPNKNKNN